MPTSKRALSALQRNAELVKKDADYSGECSPRKRQEEECNHPVFPEPLCCPLPLAARCQQPTSQGTRASLWGTGDISRPPQCRSLREGPWGREGVRLAKVV